jgi:2-dehydro-3-deoxy-D-arabinonate dehydratase
MQIIRYALPGGGAGWGLMREGQAVGQFAPDFSLAQLLELPLADFRQEVERALHISSPAALAGKILAPIEGEMEVWAAGVTYQRSVEARVEESETPDIYTRVYQAARPELFFKANARRVSGPGAPIVVRADSHWDVPEPELALVINAHAEIVGYTIANDVSSRSIEGENPLYLPQAKVYAGGCALGPGIVPVWEVNDPLRLAIRMQIERADQAYWNGETSTARLHRSLPELVEYLFREDAFPQGVILCTGTGLVPDHPFTLTEGDIVHIEIEQLGTLSNPVVCGKTALTQK